MPLSSDKEAAIVWTSRVAVASSLSPTIVLKGSLQQPLPVTVNTKRTLISYSILRLAEKKTFCWSMARWTWKISELKSQQSSLTNWLSLALISYPVTALYVNEKYPQLFFIRHINQYNEVLSELAFFCIFSLAHRFTLGPRSLHRKCLHNSSSPCSPVWLQGGVICLSAAYWHEQSLFILEESACLFIKGFDHHTPLACRF